MTTTPALRITAKRPGFRRAGMAHPDQPVVHKPGTFTPDQVKALKAESMLVVEEVAAEEAGAKPTTPPKDPPKGGGK